MINQIEAEPLPVGRRVPVKEYVNSSPLFANSNHGQDMQSRSSQPDPIAVTETETYHTLLTRAQRRTGGVPAESIVRHVLSVTHGGDWPVQREALEAVLRRCASVQADEIQIVGRPRGRLKPVFMMKTAENGSGGDAMPVRKLVAGRS